MNRLIALLNPPPTRQMAATMTQRTPIAEMTAGRSKYPGWAGDGIDVTGSG